MSNLLLGPRVITKRKLDFLNLLVAELLCLHEDFLLTDCDNIDVNLFNWLDCH